MIGYSAVAICFVFLLFREGSEILLTPTEWVHHQFQYFNIPEQNQLGVQLGQLLQPDEQFFELGEDNALYFFSRHSPPSGLLFIDPYVFGDETQIYWTRLLSDLNRTKPALVILCDNWSPMIPASAPIYPWLNRFYSPWDTELGWPHYHLLLRRGSSLQQRVSPATVFSSAAPAADAPSPPAHR